MRTVMELTEPLEATLLDSRGERELEDQTLDPGTDIRGLTQDGPNGKYTFQARDGDGWYNYASWGKPVVVSVGGEK